MFSDESLEPVHILSHAKADIYIRDQLCQTKPIKDDEKSCQTITQHDAEVQTCEERELPQATRMKIDNSKNLTNFMLTVYPLMSEQLIANMRSHCFDGYEVDWDDENDNEELLLTHTLRNVKNEEFKITSVSWNATGSLIAASLASPDHDGWCTHQSFVYLWNIDRNDVDEDNPYKIIDCDTCLLDVSFHPNQSGLLAGGNFAGKLLIWDLSNEDNLLVAYSGKDTNSHHEPIANVRWKESAKLRSHELVTVGYDGCILIWTFNQLDKALQLVHRFLLLGHNIKQKLGKNAAVKNDVEIGISCLDFLYGSQDTIFIGCENGSVFKCILNANKARKIQHRDNESYLTPQTKFYDGHIGSVNSIHLSPYNPNVFITCASDMTVHVYNNQEVSPIVTVQPSTDYLLSAHWSFSRPTVFYIGTSMGNLLVFDLTMNTVAPVNVVNVAKDVKGLQSIACNKRQTNILAVGDSKGVVTLWKLPSRFKQEKSNELTFLEFIIKNDD